MKKKVKKKNKSSENGTNEEGIDFKVNLIEESNDPDSIDILPNQTPEIKEILSNMISQLDENNQFDLRLLFKLFHIIPKNDYDKVK